MEEKNERKNRYLFNLIIDNKDFLPTTIKRFENMSEAITEGIKYCADLFVEKKGLCAIINIQQLDEENEVVEEEEIKVFFSSEIERETNMLFEMLKLDKQVN